MLDQRFSDVATQSQKTVYHVRVPVLKRANWPVDTPEDVHGRELSTQ